MIGRLAVIAAGVVAFATACGGPVAHVAGPPVEPTVVAAGSFVAAVGDSVDVLRATDGSVERVLMSSKRGDLTVNGLALRGQELFVTYSAGPRCSSGVAGCGPQPGTCGGEVDRVDLPTNARSVVWKVGRDTLLGGAEPSPGGTRIAALTSPCVPSYFNQHLAVHDIGSGATESVGGALPRCHQLGPPAWTGDGDHLVVAYAPPREPLGTPVATAPARLSALRACLRSTRGPASRASTVCAGPRPLAAPTGQSPHAPATSTPWSAAAPWHRRPGLRTAPHRRPGSAANVAHRQLHRRCNRHQPSRQRARRRIPVLQPTPATPRTHRPRHRPRPHRHRQPPARERSLQRHNDPGRSHLGSPRPRPNSDSHRPDYPRPAERTRTPVARCPVAHRLAATV